MKLAILSANLNSFDKIVEPVDQILPKGIDQIDYHCFTDSDFAPITGLTPRFQYRIPKFMGWQMQEADYYIWLDGSMSFTREDCAEWFMEQLGNADFAVFKHPWRNSIKEEADHIEEHLQQGKPYITKRYMNGLHKEQLKDIHLDDDYKDNHLYASTAFIYKDSEEVRDALRLCFLHQARYYTCDQLAFTYALKDLAVNMIKDNPFKCKYLEHVSKHS